MHTGFWCGSLTERNTHRSRRENIEMKSKEIYREGAKWLYVARLTESLWAVVNMLMEFRSPLKELNILVVVDLLAFEERHRSMNLAS
jgi:hypothetical protein